MPVVEIPKPEKTELRPVEFLDAERLLKYLSEQGIDLQQITLIRYAKHGYIMEPKRKSEIKGYGKVFYSLLAPVEVITAYYLLKGITVDSEKNIRLGAFSGSEIFIARMLFLKNAKELVTSAPYCAGSFNINLMDYLNGDKNKDSFGFNDAITRSDDLIHKILAKRYQDMLGSNFNVDAYLGYLEMLYKTTFMNVLNRYSKELNEMQDAFVKTG